MQPIPPGGPITKGNGGPIATGDGGPIATDDGGPIASDGGPFELLDMEKRLREDAGGRYREQAAAAIEAARRDLKRVVDAGVPPDEYRHLATVLHAFEAAAEVLATATPGTAGTVPQPPFLR